MVLIALPMGSLEVTVLLYRKYQLLVQGVSHLLSFKLLFSTRKVPLTLDFLSPLVSVTENNVLFS